MALENDQHPIPRPQLLSSEDLNRFRQKDERVLHPFGKVFDGERDIMANHSGNHGYKDKSYKEHARIQEKALIFDVNIHLK